LLIYFVRSDIHWQPVRIIQRFARIVSPNTSIQLVNHRQDITMDNVSSSKSGPKTAWSSPLPPPPATTIP
jgi:hypothetical protein